MKKIFIMAAVLCICGSILTAQQMNKSAKELIGEKNYAELLKNGKIIVSREDGSSNLQLLPQSQYASKIKSNLVKKQDKHFYYTYEVLYFLPKQITVQRASEIARSISKMAGIKYYSNTWKKEMVLYKNAYMIQNEKTKDPVTDKNTGNADGMVLYCLMDDNSFGETRYRLDYSQSSEELLTVFTNKDEMGLGPFRAIMPDNLVINLLIEPCSDGVLVYLCADLNSKKLPGVKGKITESMSARVEAISKWFISMM